MQTKRFLVLLPVLVLAISSSAAAAGTGPLGTTPEPLPPDAHVLVQSELDYLGGAERLVTIDLDGDTPAVSLRRLARSARIRVEIEGELPREPLLTVSFRDQPLHEVLRWFGERVGVTFRAQAPGTLVVIAHEAAAPR